MKRWSIIALILLVGAGVLAWSWFSEPRYAGKTLSAWREVAATVDESGAPTRVDEARDAISHIDARGAIARTLLLEWAPPVFLQSTSRYRTRTETSNKRQSLSPSS